MVNNVVIVDDKLFLRKQGTVKSHIVTKPVENLVGR